MTEYELNQAYFDWMYQLVYGCPRGGGLSYLKLFGLLYNIEFRYSIEMDSNRYLDGLDLRHRFSFETGIDRHLVDEYLSGRPCSVLEMMVALAIRCEEHIMENIEMGNRTGQWVRFMIHNMGLTRYDDNHFYEKSADKIIAKFLDRQYDRNGNGGLFIVDNPPRDMRFVEIWYQMSWYLEHFV